MCVQIQWYFITVNTTLTKRSTKKGCILQLKVKKKTTAYYNIVAWNGFIIHNIG